MKKPITIVVIIILLAIMLFYIWKEKTKSPQMITDIEPVTEIVEPRDILIPELGIKITTTIPDLDYIASEENPESVVFFYSKTLEREDAANCSAKEAPLGFLTKIEKGELSKNKNDRINIFNIDALIQAGAVKEMEDFFLFLNGAQAPCSSDANLQNIQSVSLKTMRETLLLSAEMLYGK